MTTISQISIHSFKQLKWAIDNWYHDQVDGKLSAVCETGDPYVDFYESAIAREKDIAMVEACVADLMYNKLKRYVGDKLRCRIYWRERLKTSMYDYSIVSKFDSDGPDIDLITGKNCFLDHNWKKLYCHCCLFLANEEKTNNIDRVKLENIVIDKTLNVFVGR